MTAAAQPPVSASAAAANAAAAAPNALPGGDFRASSFLENNKSTQLTTPRKPLPQLPLVPAADVIDGAAPHEPKPSPIAEVCIFCLLLAF